MTTVRNDNSPSTDPEVPGAVPGAAPGATGADALRRPGGVAVAGQDGRDPRSRSPRNPGVPGAPGRSRSADQRRAAIVRRLTDRDRAIVHAVSRHRVLTTDQLSEAFFPTKRRAWARLAELHRLEVLARFAPITVNWGGSVLHFVVGRTGAAIIAAERGDDPVRAARGWREERAVAIAHRQNLPHLVGLNSVWSALAGHARQHPNAELTAWLTEAEVANWAGGIVRPDGLLEWCEDGRTVEAFVEYDRGTERLSVLQDKLRAYERLEVESGRAPWVLFAFTSGGRESSARAALAETTVPVATAALHFDAPPQDAVWMPLADAHERVRLSALADVPKPQRALRRAASGSPRAWRFDRAPSLGEAPIDL
jgi:hypothetical protein